jgi:hypothetical protein
MVVLSSNWLPKVTLAAVGAGLRINCVVWSHEGSPKHKLINNQIQQQLQQRVNNKSTTTQINNNSNNNSRSKR